MSLDNDGFFLHSAVIGEAQIAHLQGVFSSLQPVNGPGLRDPARKSEEVASLSHAQEIRELLPRSDMVLVRSLLFDKSPKANWPVAWHQDRTLAVKNKIAVEGYGPWSEKGGNCHVEPPADILDEMVTLRLHLDKADESNGALRVVPGSHRVGKIPPESISEYTEQTVLTLSCQAGDILAMKPLLLHSSQRARKPSHRRVIHLEYAPQNLLPGEMEWRFSL